MSLRISSHQEINLPKLNSVLMQWRNTLCNKKKSIAFSVSDKDIKYTARIHEKQLDMNFYELGLLVEIDAVPVSIWLSSWPLAERLDSYLAGKDLDSLPIDLRAELLEMVLKPFFSLIMFHTNTQIRVLNFLSLKPSRANPFSLGFTLHNESTQQESRVLMLMHDRLFPIMQRVIAHWPNSQGDFWHQQDTRLWLQAGTLELSLQELQLLEPSDILVLDSLTKEKPSTEEKPSNSNIEATTIKKQPVRLRLGSGDFFLAQVQSDQLTLQSGIQSMSDEYIDDSHGEKIHAIEDIPVRLTFDLGDLVLPFKEVQSLTSGYIINLNTPVSQAVTIRSLNRIIGAGELVDIDGRIGVRIVKLLSKNLAQSTPQALTDG